MNSVPVELPNVWGGFARASGLLRDDGAFLTLEYEIRDSVFGVVRKTHTANIPVTAVADVQYRGGLFGWFPQILIRAGRLEPFAGLPGFANGVLRVKPKDRAAAKAFVDGLHVKRG